MASPSAILRAAKASQAPVPPTPPPQGQWWGAYSPAALNSDSAAGYAPPFGPFLPRPPSTFTSGAFGPFSPILPVPVDQPPPGFQRAQPRRWQYPVGWNLPVGQPGSEGLKLASFATLKALADSYSIMRTCLKIRMDEIRALDWDIALTKDAAKAYRGDREAMRDFGERRAEALKWFRKPDPNYSSFSSWFYALMEQLFVYDSVALYMCPTMARGRGKGLLGSGLDSLWLIDGSTVRPLVDLHGGRPQPPAPSYQQFLYAVPRSDLIMMRDGRDLGAAGLTEGDMTGQFRGDQLLYLPYFPRADTPYGFSIVEQAIIPIMTGLQKQAMQLEYFTEGTIPGVYISPGDSSMTANQIRELQDALNAIAGDVAWRYKVIVLPPGSKTMPQKQMDIVDQSDEWIATECCMVAGINPMELGILPRVSTVASPFAAREMAQASRTIHQRVATKPTLKYLVEIADLILQTVAGQDDMRFIFNGMEEEQDLAAQTDMGVKQVQSGISSIDEVRETLGKTPWGLPETSAPVVFTTAGPLPLTDAGNMDSASDNMAATGALTDAHAAAAAGQGRKAIPAGASGTGRMNGPVTQRQARRGGALAPAHATAEGAPGRSGGPPAPKAALAELAALTRHVRKGRDVATWRPEHLEAWVLAAIEADLEAGTPLAHAAAKAAQAVVKAASLPLPPQAAAQLTPWQRQQLQQLAQKYGPLVQQAFTQALAQAQALIAQWAAGTLAVTAAALAGMIAALIAKALLAVLLALWAAAWKIGRKAAEAAAGVAVGARRVAEDLEAFLARERGWAHDISQSRIAELADEIAAALADGDPASAGDRLAEVLRVAWRSGLIAATEATRAANAAAQAVYRAAGVAYKTWQTRRDAKVCPRCRANQDQGPVPLSAVFSSGNEAPPAHPRCLVGSTRVSAPSLTVVSADEAHRSASRVVPAAAGSLAAAAVAVAGRDFGWSNIRAATEREYVGEVVTIHTASGHELTATPNHPIATRGGWIPIAELAVGDHVLSSTRAEWVTAAVDPDENDIPPSIKEVAESLPVLLGAVPLAPEDFHGDGAGSDVCVIRADRLLVDNLDAGGAEHACEQDFRPGDIRAGGAAPLQGQRSPGEVFSSEGTPPDRVVGGLREASALLGAGGSHAHVHGGAPAARSNAGPEQAPANDVPSDAEGFCERLLAFAPDITLDEIVHVERNVVATHVYNLETAEGWYIGNGIITHNCRCWIDSWQPPARKAARRQVGLNGQVVWEDEQPEPNPAGGGAAGVPAHAADGTQMQVPGGVPGATAGGEPPRWDGTEPFPHVLSLPSGDDGQATGGPRGTGTPGTYWPAQYMDGWWPQGGHGTAQPPATSVGSGPRGRAPNAVGKRGKDPAKLLAAAPEAAAGAVYRQMRRNYPARSIAWMKGLDWRGPVEVPLELIDWASEGRWAAHHQPARVAHFERRLASHSRVDPAVGIIRPGEKRIRVIDGHHRSLACKRMGWPSRMYVAVVDDPATVKAALESHLYQIHQGDDPANKSFTAGNLGLPGNVSGLVPFNLSGQAKVSKPSVNYRKAADRARSCGTCSMFIPGGSCFLVAGRIRPGDTCDRWEGKGPVAAKVAGDGIRVAGLAVRAGDTGRVLMIQRARTDGDPGAGLWELPGGHMEPGETPLDAAGREWEEEVGHRLPEGRVRGVWDASNGIWRGFVYEIPSEDVVDLEHGRGQVQNPDGDVFEAVAWFDPSLIEANPSVRPELAADYGRLADALAGKVAA